MWTLSDSGEPLRTDSSYSSTSEEMETALTRSLGTLTFRLQNMDFLKDFEPAEHAGRRMQAKGYLIRQPAVSPNWSLVTDHLPSPNWPLTTGH